jgi:hypothetical protein
LLLLAHGLNRKTYAPDVSAQAWFAQSLKLNDIYYRWSRFFERPTVSSTGSKPQAPKVSNQKPLLIGIHSSYRPYRYCGCATVRCERVYILRRPAKCALDLHHEPEKER